MATTVNYDDERFTQVESDKQQALTDIEQTYGGMIDESDKFYQTQIDASKDWADKQQQIQQEQTDFAIEQIEQQKEQAQKDYTKEQAGAYVDWQKQSNQYGANAEQMAASGLQNTGYSESSQVSMYNTYQNRVSTARESFNKAVLNYNNSIKDAQLQNSAALAEIAYNALQQQLQLALEQFQYKNNLLLELTNQKQQINSEYYNRWMDVVSQINTENALAEEIRQYNEKMAYQKEQDALAQAQWEKEFAFKQEQAAQEQANWEKEFAYATSKSSSGGSGGGSSSGSSSGVAIKSSNTSSNTSNNTSNNSSIPQSTLQAISQYGVYSDGLPLGIIGVGTVTRTGQTVSMDGKSEKIVTTKDGSKWAWSSAQKKYLKLTNGPDVTSAAARLDYKTSK